MARFLCTVAILIIGPLAGIAVAVVAFILSGTLSPGEPMYVGSSTPSLSTAAQIAACALALTAVLAYARHQLGRVALQAP